MCGRWGGRPPSLRAPPRRPASKRPPPRRGCASLALLRALCFLFSLRHGGEPSRRVASQRKVVRVVVEQLGAGAYRDGSYQTVCELAHRLTCSTARAV